MKKNAFIKHDEIDLTELTRTIWNEKIKIILIICISILVGVCFNFLRPDLYQSSVIIKPSKNSQFTKFKQITDFININQSKFENPKFQNVSSEYKYFEYKYLEITNDSILESFIEELNDTEELIIVLNNIEKKKNQISDSLSDDQKQKIFYYAKSFSVNKVEKKSDYFLKFEWDNKKESIEIIDETIKLALINFRNSFFQELKDHLEGQKIVFLNLDLNRIDFLKEQSLIARKLGILEGKIEDIDQSQQGYYTRGFVVIDKEISIIQSREYQDFNNNLENINLLKELELNWINYNLFLIKIDSIKNLQKTLIISILIGLVVGLFYIFISNALKPQKRQKK